MNATSSLLDATLDDLNDLPEFKVFPPGAYRVSISWEEKEINKHPSIELKMKALETLELSESTDIPPAEGDECGMAFMLDNEFGVGKFKAVLKPITEHLGMVGSLNREVVEASEGMEGIVVTKIRTKKDDKDVKYLEIVSFTPV